MLTMLFDASDPIVTFFKGLIRRFCQKTLKFNVPKRLW